MARMLSMAARNLFRSPLRTSITVLGIAFGLSMILFTYSLNYGNYQSMLEKGIRGAAGHVVVQHPDWQDNPEPEFNVQGSAQVAQDLQAAMPDAIVTRRLFSGGLAMSSSNNVAVGVLGIDPVSEAELGETDDKLVDGEWLAEGDAKGAMIGDTLAKRLDVGIGDRLVVMAPDPADETQSTSQLFRVRGIFHSGIQTLDSFSVMTTVEGAQPFVLGDDPAHQVAVIFENDDTSLEAVATATPLVGDAGKVLHWKDAVPDLRAFIQVDTQTNDTFFFIIGLVVLLGVVNTILMSVLERVREFGVMLAVGMRPIKLAALILTEGFVVGTIAAILGLVLGILMVWPATVYGLDFSAAMGETMEMGDIAIDTVLYPQFSWPRMLGYTLTTIVLTTIAAGWPAFRVTRLKPIEAIQHL
jgi:ABC-type lipoprotein release transport system permease subunit